MDAFLKGITYSTTGATKERRLFPGSVCAGQSDSRPTKITNGKNLGGATPSPPLILVNNRDRNSYFSSPFTIANSKSRLSAVA